VNGIGVLGELHPDSPPAAPPRIWGKSHYSRITIPGITPVYYSFMKRTDRALGPFPARR